MTIKNKAKIAINAKSDLKKCATQLKKLRPNVTADDRRKAMAEYSVSYGTIGRYLTGKVLNPTLGTDLLQFFIQQQRKRKEIIKESGKEIPPLTKK